MKSRVKLYPEGLGPLAAAADLALSGDRVREAVQSIRERRGPGSEFLGWLDLPFADPGLEDHAAALREEIDTLIVVGIGGSYLGARALLEATAWRRAKRSAQAFGTCRPTWRIITRRSMSRGGTLMPVRLAPAIWPAMAASMRFAMWSAASFCFVTCAKNARRSRTFAARSRMTTQAPPRFGRKAS